MKQCVACLCVLSLSVACGASNAPTDSRTSAGGATGSGGAQMNGGGGGVTTGGTSAAAGSAGVGAGGTGNGGGAGGSPGVAGAGGGAGASGNAGAGGGAGSGATAGFKCPAGPFDAPALAGKTATRIAGAPPSDDFNKNNYGNVEGPVWIGDSLYFSEMKNGDVPLARILKIAPGGVVSVAVPSSGSNGLAVDNNGNLFAAVHKDGSISEVALPSGTETPIVSMYMGKRFTSPNDLAIRSDGTIYFSDPSFQNSANPQGATRLYRVTPAPERAISVVVDAPNPPNGVTLSPDEKTLYVSGSGLKKFAVMTDGSLGAGSDFVTGGGGDGMVVDCAGNLYVAGSNALGSGVAVYAPTGGAPLGTIAVNAGANTTNVAFGGTDHKTLYITVMGNDGTRGVFSIALNVPGFPY